MIETLGAGFAIVMLIMVLVLYLLFLVAPIAIWVYCAKINRRVKEMAGTISRIEQRLENGAGNDVYLAEDIGPKSS